MRALSHSGGRSRNGNIALILLIALPLFIVALLMTLNMGLLVTAHCELQRCVDASALAAAHCLLDDDALRTPRFSRLARLRCCHEEAEFMLALNSTVGHPRGPEHNRLGFGHLIGSGQGHDRHAHDAGSECHWGTLTFGCCRNDGRFAPLLDLTGNEAAENVEGEGHHEDEDNQINCVQVRVGRVYGWGRWRPSSGNPFWSCFQGRVECGATAILDCHVLGFRPVFANQCIPLVPLALCGNPDEDADDEDGLDNDNESSSPPRSWHAQLRAARIVDQWSRNGDQHCFVRQDSGDGIPEITIRLDCQDADGGNGCMVLFREFGDCDRQIREGVGRDDLDGAWGGQLTLDSQGELTVPGLASGRVIDPKRCQQLAECLRELQQAHCPRIFPLYSCRRDDGSVVINDFVAARVVSVKVEDGGRGVKLVLQPTQMSTACAVTARDCGINPPIPVRNRYVCKIRLVHPVPFNPNASLATTASEPL